MKNAILTGAVVFMLGLIVSCSPTSHKAKELTAKGYTVCEHEKGLWYYNADSVFYYDAEKDMSRCVLFEGKEFVEFLFLECDFDKQGNLYATFQPHRNAEPIFFDSWNMPTGVNGKDTTGLIGIKFCGDKGFVFYSMRSEYDDGNFILYSTAHPDTLYFLGEMTDIVSNDTEIQTTLKEFQLPEMKGIGKELYNVLWGEYGNLTSFLWNVFLDYDGNIIRTADEILLDQLGINIKNSNHGLSGYEVQLKEQADFIKKKATKQHVINLVKRSNDIRSINELFRNKTVAENEIVGTSQIVMARVDKEIERSLLLGFMEIEGKKFQMETGDFDFTAVLYTLDPKFDELHLPALILFRGEVSDASHYNQLFFSNCKLVAVLESPNDGIYFTYVKYKEIATGKVIELFDPMSDELEKYDTKEFEWMGSGTINIMDYIQESYKD